MSKTVLFLSVETSGMNPSAMVPPFVNYQDYYQLENIDLTAYNGVYLAGWCDQLYLLERYNQMTDYVKQGGRLFINGHPRRHFIQGLPQHRTYEFKGMDDLLISRVGEHPIWEGIDFTDVWLRTGVPGSHSLETLKEIGVAGFYARSYLEHLPQNTTVISGIGTYNLPVDITYPLEKGTVVLHPGLELPIFAYQDRSTKNLGKQLFAWLQGDN